MSLNTTNPYANNSQLTSTEKDVLWEYAKLSDKIKRAASLARETTKSPNESLLDELRVLEKRMGLVLTLVQASVWAFITVTACQKLYKLCTLQSYKPLVVTSIPTRDCVLQLHTKATSL
ncbi:hypothetical protein L204_101554 [Cryptococcus depauperatus]